MSAPVEHLRDVRTELLLKLALRMACPARRRLARGRLQRERSATPSLRSRRATPTTISSPCRRGHARAVRRFLDAVAGPPAASVVAGGSPLRLSARTSSPRPPLP
ncbi:MAG: hypothetical protein WKF58_02875 [Ilumatobacteraceae bacterium]